MKRITFGILFALALGTGANAQTADSGKKVRRITFDREQVTVVYQDGSTDEAVSSIVVKEKDVVTSLKGINGKNLKGKDSEVFDLQGRRLNPNTMQKRSGVYVKREGNQVRKIVKK